MSEDSQKIRIVAVCGSVRPGNYTEKALAVVVDEFGKHPRIALDIVQPATLELPFPGQKSDSPDAERLREVVAGATGVVLATPEYHGGFSSVIKLVIENLGFPSALAGKPVSLLGVAAGGIGAIKSLENLRSVCSHVGAIVLPGSISIARVRDAFDAEGRVKDAKLEARIRSVATDLIDYIEEAICPRLTLEAIVREGAA